MNDLKMDSMVSCERHKKLSLFRFTDEEVKSLDCSWLPTWEQKFDRGDSERGQGDNKNKQLEIKSG